LAFAAPSTAFFLAAAVEYADFLYRGRQLLGESEYLVDRHDVRGPGRVLIRFFHVGHNARTDRIGDGYKYDRGFRLDAYDGLSRRGDYRDYKVVIRILDLGADGIQRRHIALRVLDVERHFAVAERAHLFLEGVYHLGERGVVDELDNSDLIGLVGSRCRRRGRAGGFAAGEHRGGYRGAQYEREKLFHFDLSFLYGGQNKTPALETDSKDRR
jgi:hypothetical protein